jgi:hypothetical protein
MGFTTSDPQRETPFNYEIGTVLHEGSLGHGFDDLPNAYNSLSGIPAEKSILSSGDLFDDHTTQVSGTYFNSPGYAMVSEGWATFGEIVGIDRGLYVYVNDAGEVDRDADGNVIVNTAAIMLGLNSLSRIGSRQIVDTGMNEARFAYSFNRAIQEQYENTRIARTNGFFRSMMNRFLVSPNQQTTYASGLVTNLGLQAFVRNRCAELNRTFMFSSFVEFRIDRTDYLIGSDLFAIADLEIDRFCPAGGRRLSASSRTPTTPYTGALFG